MKTAITSLQNIRTKQLFWIILTAIALVLSWYGYLLNSTVGNIVAEERMGGELKKVILKLTESEARYHEEKGAVTLEKAREMGFVDATEIAFVGKKSQSVTLAK